MQIRFWGTRGSIPVAANRRMLREKAKRALRLAEGRRFEKESDLERFLDESFDSSIGYGFGGDSSCVQIEAGGEYMVCDMGSGLRRLGQKLMAEFGRNERHVYHFFMSHVHWDHIMGFPFFTPAYIPGNTIHIYGGHEISVLEDAFRRQQSTPCFPIDWEQLGADISFTHLDVDGSHEINGFQVKLLRQAHHGASFGYRFEKGGKALVYSTDAEYKHENENESRAVEDFFRNADLVIFDAMYSLADTVTIKEDWGHSSNLVGVDLCLRAKVRHFCMFHHEPAYDDAKLDTIFRETKRYEEIVRENHALKISSAYDDLVIDL